MLTKKGSPETESPSIFTMKFILARLLSAAACLLMVQARLSASPIVARRPIQPTTGECCRYTGPVAFDCQMMESLPVGADRDGRCNEVNQGQSCTWNYSNPTCCELAVTDQVNPDGITCTETTPTTTTTTKPTAGTCCKNTGSVPEDCAFFETLGAGADRDGRCNAVNQGHSCSWDYSDPDCCQRAVADGFNPTGIVCEKDPDEPTTGECCRYTGPVPYDCKFLESLPVGANRDGRCNEVNHGQSCIWDYTDVHCCELAVRDGVNPDNIICH